MKKFKDLSFWGKVELIISAIVLAVCCIALAVLILAGVMDFNNFRKNAESQVESLEIYSPYGKHVNAPGSMIVVNGVEYRLQEVFIEVGDYPEPRISVRCGAVSILLPDDFEIIYNYN